MSFVALVLAGATQLRAKSWFLQHSTIIYIFSSIPNRRIFSCKKSYVQKLHLCQWRNRATLEIYTAATAAQSDGLHKRYFLHSTSSTEGGFSASTCVVVQLINGLTVTAVTHTKFTLKQVAGFLTCIMTWGHNSEP